MSDTPDCLTLAIAIAAIATIGMAGVCAALGALWVIGKAIF